jgi:hypothetical protein
MRRGFLVNDRNMTGTALLQGRKEVKDLRFYGMQA